MKAFFTLAIFLKTFAFSSFCQSVPPYTASFVGRMGTDTVLIETYTINNNHLYGRAFTRVPEDYIADFTIHFYTDGSMREFNINAMNPINSSVPFEAKSRAFEYRLNMNCQNDTCTYYNSDPNFASERIVKHPAKHMDFVGGWVPLISLMEWNCMRLAKSKQQAISLNMINHNIGVYPISLHYKDTGKMIFGGPFLEYTTISVDPHGRISDVNGIGTPWNYIVTKHSPIDIDEIAQRMTQTPGIGIPSPTESSTFEIKGSKISLTYGRPHKRGRVIFGGVVPYDSLWRTGANGPTTIKFERNVKFGKQLVPQGEYSIYTIPKRDEWLLIFSKDQERWPTDPDRSKEFVQFKIPVQLSNEAVQQFTILIQQTKKGGQLQFLWDNVIATTDFEVLK